MEIKITKLMNVEQLCKEFRDNSIKIIGVTSDKENKHTIHLDDDTQEAAARNLINNHTPAIPRNFKSEFINANSEREKLNIIADYLGLK